MVVRARSSLDSLVRWTISTSSVSSSGEVDAEALEPGDVRLEGILDVGGVPLRRLGFVKLVEQVAAEFEELPLLNGCGKFRRRARELVGCS